MKQLVTIFIVTGFVVVALASAQDSAQRVVPPELTRLVANARLEGAVGAWCRAKFRAGHPDAFAVAMASPTGGGRYVALEPDGRMMVLGSFTSSPDLSCYTRARAEELHTAIKQSETIDGNIRPRWKTTVVCGFTEDIAATCWQYSPVERTFVKVGGWVP
jgi:hypothetical protein